MTMFMPIILMNAILLTVTVLLLIANKLLVTYGSCTVKVSKGDESQNFTVEGGSTLLSYFKEHNVEISSSCGGKGSCGYCKCRVEKGGAQILPTEEVFMTRQEKAKNMRLACQVKVKNDIEVIIPDYLDTVRQMVIAKKFKQDKKWSVKVF